MWEWEQGLEAAAQRRVQVHTLAGKELGRNSRVHRCRLGQPMACGL